MRPDFRDLAGLHQAQKGPEFGLAEKMNCEEAEFSEPKGS